MQTNSWKDSILWYLLQIPMARNILTKLKYALFSMINRLTYSDSTVSTNPFAKIAAGWATSWIKMIYL